jgi:hypothetical protein
MEYPSLVPEMVLQLFHILFYCMAYIFAGAAFIGLSVYIVLVCSEMFFSQPRWKTQRARVPQSAHSPPVAEESLDMSAAETPILAAPERLRQEAVRVNAPPPGAQIPMTAHANLESEATWP